MGSAGEGHHQKWGWMSRNKSCFKVDSDTQISMGALQSLLDKKKKKERKKTHLENNKPSGYFDANYGFSLHLFSTHQ